MTVSPQIDKKQLAREDGLAGGSSEAIPSYEEATGTVPNTSAATPAASSSSTSQSNSQRMYPFPSLGTQNEGYGQSPYQSDGTLRIVIAQTPLAGNDGTTLLPLHANQQSQRRGPRAGRRFCAAFFWAIVLYMIMATVLGIVLDLDDDTMPPRKRPTGGPPGWHHHHDRDGRHAGQSFYQRLLFSSPNTDAPTVS